MSLGKPLASYRLTQGFGPTLVAAEPAMYTSSQKASFARGIGLAWHSHVHPAIDLGGNREGTSIVASDDGVVDFAGPAICPGPECGGGIVVEVKVASGWHFVVCHCSALAVRVGQRVQRGQTIAYVGDTGNALGAHVHFQVYEPVVAGHRVWWDPRLFFEGGPRANDGTFGSVLPDTATQEEDPLPAWTSAARPAAVRVTIPAGTKIYDLPDPTSNARTWPTQAAVLSALQVTANGYDWWGYAVPAGGVLWVPQKATTAVELDREDVAAARAAGIRDAAAAAAATK